MLQNGNVASKVTNMIKHQEDYESQGGEKLPEDFLTGLLFKRLTGNGLEEALEGQETRKGGRKRMENL